MKYVDGRSSDPFWIAYSTQRKNAKKRGIGFPITFQEWKEIWLSSGKFFERGRNRGQYVMCRVGDAGEYAVGNVFIATNADNTRQMSVGHVKSEATLKKMSDSQKGKPRLYARGHPPFQMTDEVREKIRASKLGSTNPNAAKAAWTAMRTPMGIFENGAKAAKAFSVTTRTAHNRCVSSNFPDWSYA